MRRASWANQGDGVHVPHRSISIIGEAYDLRSPNVGSIRVDFPDTGLQHLRSLPIAEVQKLKFQVGTLVELEKGTRWVIGKRNRVGKIIGFEGEDLRVRFGSSGMTLGMEEKELKIVFGVRNNWEVEAVKIGAQAQALTPAEMILFMPLLPGTFFLGSASGTSGAV